MKKIMLLCALLAITGCSPRSDQLNFPILPEELKDCKFYYLRNENGGHSITVARCPNSSTSVQSGGKHKVRSLLIDSAKDEK